MSETTEITKVQAFKQYQLTEPDRVFAMRDEDALLAQIGRSFPGELKPGERAVKGRALVEQVHIAITNAPQREKILACGGDTILQAVIDMAYLDLSPNKATGECYLIPYSGVATLMIGYKGFKKLILNTGKVSTLESVLVYDCEKFVPTRDDTGPHWEHEIDVDVQGQYDRIVACYCWASMRGGGPPMFELANRAQLDKIKNVSKSSGSPAYKQWLGEMYRKAPLRRLAKWMDLNADASAQERYVRALELDNRTNLVDRVEAAQVERREQSKELFGGADKILGQAEPERAADGEIIPPVEGASDEQG